MSNVVSLADYKNKKADSRKKKAVNNLIDALEDMKHTERVAKDAALEVFKEAERKNKETEERMKKDRINVNKSVLRSYRIKN